MSSTPVVKVRIDRKMYRAGETAHSIAIDLDFGPKQPRVFGLPKAAALKKEGTSASTPDGSPCNFDTYIICPHENGTHTECIGHICDEGVFINDVLKDVLVTARLVSLPLTAAFTLDDRETVPVQAGDHDLVISSDAVKNIDVTGIEALIIRTLPNAAEKKGRHYTPVTSPYFSAEAISTISATHLQHLVVDFPSVDRLDDGGVMGSHRRWWGMPEGVKSVKKARYPHRTITEMAWIDNTIEDGLYLLNLQIPAWLGDAAPSRPVLLPLTVDS